MVRSNNKLANTFTLACCAAVAIVFATQASAKPRHKIAASRGNIETNVSPTDQDNPARVVEPENMPAAAARTASARTPRHSRRAALTAQASAQSSGTSFGSGDLVSDARRYLGSNPTGRRSLWCGAFMDKVLKDTGHAGGGNLASAYARYGTRVSGPQVGAIAVMGRKGGGHVGVVSGLDPSGNPIIISGNHNNTVAESVYPRGRIFAYVMPN
jgi:uncharacterized protein (TIGR02594 family)